jgi:ATP-dependent DNA helicase DinG
LGSSLFRHVYQIKKAKNSRLRSPKSTVQFVQRVLRWVDQGVGPRFLGLRIDGAPPQNYSWPMPESALDIRNILGPGGMLARSLEGFEPRDGQIRMALLLEEAIESGVSAIVEAGTGTGKTFGYLVPLILTGRKAVISTGTKNLQEQIRYKDLPLLEKATGRHVDAVIMKGRKNYLCLLRYHQYAAQPFLPMEEAGEVRKRIDEWLNETEFADRSELPWMPDDDPLWDAFSASGDQCLGADCRFLEECFLTKLRGRAARARLIIVNHHLFFADLKVKKGGFGEIIPRFQVLVFDEAHDVEEIATLHLGESISTNQVSELAADLIQHAKAHPDAGGTSLLKHAASLRAAADALIALFDSGPEKGRVETETLAEIRRGPARDAARSLRYLSEKSCLGESENLSAQLLLSRAGELAGTLDEIFRKRDETWLNWYERRKKSILFYVSPLDVSGALKRLLYENVKTVQLTSATLSTDGGFSYIRGRLGLPDQALEGIYPSEFDFRSQALLYLPRDLPLPGDADFGRQVAERVLEILKRTQGRAMVLFTSHHNLNIVYGLLADRLPYTIFRQGQAPRTALLEAFKQDIHSVLLATGSFWQGVDVPGESLSCLIIDKLPFDSPGEPLVAARIEAIRASGGNPFMEYQLPSAIISLKQGLGRLIRKRTDRGILSVLDKRIVTSRYGRRFMAGLPGMPITQDLGDIDRFFGG